MSHESHVSDHDEQHLSYGKYAIGFLTSVALTLSAYWLATRGTASANTLAIILAILAVTQYIVQMLLFLHVGEERGPRWKLSMMFMMLIVVLILVGGSIWIMNNLNYRMTPQQVMQYMQNQDNL
jgi:cytochrome o ubiquinol oxidase operon protein cyoD